MWPPARRPFWSLIRAAASSRAARFRRPARAHTLGAANSAVPSRPPKTGKADDQSSCVHDAEGVGPLGPGVVFVSWLLGLERLPWHSRRSALATFLGGQELPVSANQSQTSSAHWHIEALTLEFGRNPLEQLAGRELGKRNELAPESAFVLTGGLHLA